MEQNLSEQILQKIKDEHIQPKPRWSFILKNVSLWLLVAASLIVGSLACSIVIYMVDNNQWDLSDKISHNFLAFVIVTLPYFWLIILGLFVVALYHNFRHTAGGYKYPTIIIIAASLALSFCFGVLLYNSGLSPALDRLFEEHVPLYQRFVSRRQFIFNQPDNGLLPGQVQTIINPSEFMLLDPDDQSWHVIEAPLIMGWPVLPGQRVLVIGQKQDDNIFSAWEIRDLMPDRHQGMRQYFQIQIWH